MNTGYTPIIIFLVLVAAFAVLSLIASALLRPKRPNPAKLSPYECGITPERLPQSERFPIKFYVIAMLFIIFDVETIFLYPWAVELRAFGLFGLVEMVVFIGLVFVAYVFVLRKGGLEWEGLERGPRVGRRFVERSGPASPGGGTPPSPRTEPAAPAGVGS